MNILRHKQAEGWQREINLTDNIDSLEEFGETLP